MSGWHRLFVVIAILGAIAAPFVLMDEMNEPIRQASSRCTDVAYRNYGSGDSRIRLDMDKYHDETASCFASFIRDFVSIKKVASAVIGMGDRTLGLVTWGFILIPFGLL
jgi:hypothetical protein